MRPEWEELPQEIQEKMLENQEKQTGKRKPDVFIKDTTSTKSMEGFTWALEEGHGFWNRILIMGNIDSFYNLYPKSPIKPEYESLYKKTFKVNRIPQEVNVEKIKELNLEYILNIPQSN